MRIILKADDGVLVTRNGNLVRKIVRGKNSSGLKFGVGPTEMVNRELEALKRLSDVEGIQRATRRESRDTFYSQFIEGHSLRGFRDQLPRSYFDKLEEMEMACFDRGVYRLGKNRSDFLISSSEEPAIIDFGNVILSGDPIARIPGVLGLAKAYCNIRISDLRSRYCPK